MHVNGLLNEIPVPYIYIYIKFPKTLLSLHGGGNCIRVGIQSCIWLMACDKEENKIRLGKDKTNGKTRSSNLHDKKFEVVKLICDLMTSTNPFSQQNYTI